MRRSSHQPSVLYWRLSNLWSWGCCIFQKFLRSLRSLKSRRVLIYHKSNCDLISIITKQTRISMYRNNHTLNWKLHNLIHNSAYDRRITLLAIKGFCLNNSFRFCVRSHEILQMSVKLLHSSSNVLQSCNREFVPDYGNLGCQASK